MRSTLARRIGGPDAVTWPLFWVTLAASALVQFAIPQAPAPTWLRVLGVLLAQVAMFIPLLALRRVLLRSSRPRPGLVVSGYVLAVVIRAAIMGGVLALAAPPPVSFASRALSSLPITVIFVLTTVMVNTSREHVRDQIRLLQAREDLVSAQVALTQQIEQRNEEALNRVQARLVAELDELERAAEPLAAVQRLASDVVRPMSHELAQSAPSWQPPPRPVAVQRVDWGQVVTGLGRGGPFLPLFTAILAGIFMGATTFVYLQDVRVAGVLLAFSGSLVGFWGVNRVLDRVLPLTTRVRSLTAVVAGGLFAAAVPFAALIPLVGGPPGLRFGVFGVLIMAGVALLVAVIGEVQAAQTRTTEDLERSTGALRVSLVRLHQAQWYHQRALALALHGTVQTAVVSAALRLDEALKQGRLSPELVEQIRVDLGREVDVLAGSARQPKQFPQFVEELISVWSRVAEIDMSADPAARRLVDADPMTRAIVMEVAAETASNALRHGNASRVEIRLRGHGAVLNMVVASDSREDAGPRLRGLGTRLLDDCTLRWQERLTPDGVEVHACFPVATPEPESLGSA